MGTLVSSATKEVIIGDGNPTVLIGERINPAGRKKLQEALKKGDLEIVQKEAVSQAEAGADILDISVGTFGVDEVELLPRVVQLLIETVDLPLCIDSAYPETIEAALKVYKGKALINSVTAEEHSLAKVLPLVKDYGAAVIGLLQDDEGIPKNSEQRLTIARKLVERIEAAGIPQNDLIIDCLSFAVGAAPESGPAVIEAIRKIKVELGVNMTLGASNVSFGLPDRQLLNRAFVAMAIASGVSCLIVDVFKVRPAVLASDLILGRDKYGRRYTEAYRQRQKL
ncbi:MAG: pterin-binding protein [Deltaproteobacteria bacterium]|nr:pterin-binding protein [Deltaproteobacteria bacterium]MBM4322637.1 pterin-binding protein [Deltaproteobacteria bacterium]